MKILLSILSILVPGLIVAQSYNINWWKVAGGGGSSTGGTYSLNGTIGQPDAGGPLAGGNYTVTGGFWSLLSAVQTAGTPILTIQRARNGVTISWSATAGEAFVLQTNGTLSAAGWAAYGGAFATNAGAVSTTISPPSGRLFFRLRGP
jgi:hypothetical protein